MTKLNRKDAGALSEFVGRIRSELSDEVTQLRLYGSKARGGDTPESDIDVFIVVRSESRQLENRILDIAFDVNLAHDVYISPCVVSESVLRHPVWRITPFLESVARSGIPL